MGYLDLYLVYWYASSLAHTVFCILIHTLHINPSKPIAFNKNGQEYDRQLTTDLYSTWQKLEEMVEKGNVQTIGVS
ncbi:hypothetical protein HGRIS_014869 [Hohenbuehelia grisea]|uniref:Uncharacterized protein n=1 Tax=Hohenbuehelia grisea TaxID=104357 RepID=A0ABR3IQZ9_9AGAR